jgi:ATP-dependent Lon protease
MRKIILRRREIMAVFDFTETPQEKTEYVCTYTTFNSNERTATVERPILVLDNSKRKWGQQSSGVFHNLVTKTAFEFKEEDGKWDADILKIDARFVSLLKWLGKNHINVRLTGANTEEGFAVYQIRELSLGGSGKLSAEDGFLQYMMGRLFASNAPQGELDENEDLDEDGDDMKLTSLQSITDFMSCAGKTLPDNIRLWARRNLAVAQSHEVTPEERRHAQRALSIMMNIQWKNNYFESIDPEEARRILDEELYGMERVKQRIIETIIQINRTHTLPAYGILLIGPAGTGKSQIAYAVARILKLPWTSLDMSSINDAEQLTGSSRIYSNAKPGIIMEAFSMAGESNLVFIINELDKASSGKGNGNPADVLLTLLDNLGFTDNYMECMIPTSGVYPIATANDRDQISAPLMSRFAVIEIPGYTKEEKMVIFRQFVLPKVLKRMGLNESECIVTDGGLSELIDHFANTEGIRDLEQAAEHLAGNAMYQIEVDHLKQVVFDAKMVKELLS